jgi:hypothetical protein
VESIYFLLDASEEVFLFRDVFGSLTIAVHDLRPEPAEAGAKRLNSPGTSG